MNTATGSTTALQALVHYFESLSPATLAQLDAFYADDARFKDPFNDVTGVAAIRRIFEHMFQQLQSPRFVVTNQVQQGQQCFLTWDFVFGFKTYQQGKPLCIKGATHLVLSETGLVTLHRDYWDAAEELYEKLPVVGGVMRWLKNRMS